MFTEVTWAMSPVSLYFPNPGQSGPWLYHNIFLLRNVYTGAPFTRNQIRQNSLASLADAKGARGVGAVTGAAVAAPNRTRRVSPGTHALGTLWGRCRRWNAFPSPTARFARQVPRNKGTGCAGGDWPGIT